jgi:putative serine protease PepD
MTDHDSNLSRPGGPESGGPDPAPPGGAGFPITGGGSGHQSVPVPPAGAAGGGQQPGEQWDTQQGHLYSGQAYGGQAYGGQAYGGQAYGGAGYPVGQAGYGQPSPEPRRSASGKVLGVIAAVLVLVMCAGVAGGIVGAWANQQWLGAPSPTETRVIDGPRLDRASLASIANEVQPSVVSIRAGQGQGSGVVMDGDGHIITNAHVVQAAGGQVSVRFSNGEVAQASVIGLDRRSDIAVVRANGVADLTPARFGDSGDVLVGDTVLAIGSPLGFEGSVTQGIISAVDRTLPRQAPGEPSLSGLLQTDAAINRGNSGGPLVNLAGEVVGINTAIAVQDPEAGFLGVGFAVPSNRAMDVADQLIAGEEVRHAFLGVSVISAEGGGALIGQVVPGSPADDAGLQEGDIVVRMGDRAITDANDLVSAVQSADVGEAVEVEFNRDGDTMTATVTLGEHVD